MDQKVGAKYTAQAHVMKALSHPTRIFIVDQLAKKELCVNEITEMVGVDTSTISKHLALLKSAGVVDSRKHGTSMYYFLKMSCVLKFFHCIDEVLRMQLKEQEALILTLKD